MEMNKTCVDGNKKANSKKAKTSEALRAFIKLIQKPGKKKSDHSHDNDDNEQSGNSIISTQHSESNLDLLGKKRISRSWSRFKLWAHNKNDAGLKKDVVVNSKLAHNVHDKSENVNKTDGCCTENGQSGINDLNNDIADDDDVFFNDSYFEDDYTEDYSGSTSSGGYGDVYRCCDEPEAFFDQAFDDGMDIFYPYHNNLNSLESTDKDYNKIIPECMIKPVFPEFPDKDFESKSNRYRRYSMPCDLSRVNLMDLNCNVCTCKELSRNKTETRRLKSCGENTALRCDEKAVNLERYSDIVKESKGATHERLLGSQPPNSINKIPISNEWHEHIKTNLPVQGESPVSNLGSKSTICDNPTPTVQAECKSTELTNSTPENTASFFDTKFKSLVNLETQRSSNPPTDVRFQSQSNQFPFLSSEILVQSNTAMPRDENENVIHHTGRRHSSHGSLESGYVTSSRASSTSNPISPTIHDAPFLQLNDAPSQQTPDAPSPFSIPSFEQFPNFQTSSLASRSTRNLTTPVQKCKSSSRSVPAMNNHVTPLHKLHSGKPLSPYSRNALDGIITADSKKPRPTPRRTLKPKYIFSPTSPGTLLARTASDFKTVPELDLLAACDESTRSESKTNAEPSARAKITRVNTDETLQQRLKIDVNVDRDNVISDDKTIKSNPVNINLNVSVSIVDLDQNPRKPICTGENQHLGSLSSLPVSPPPRDLPPLSHQPSPSTPIDASQTPAPRAPTIADFLNEMVVTSPFGKTMRPICTSSPLPNKYVSKINKRQTASAIITTNRTSSANNINTPLNRQASLELSPFSPVQINCKKLASPSFRPKKTPNKMRENKTDKDERSNSERRKRLVKRKSARTRLNFDGKDVTDKLKEKDNGKISDTSIPNVHLPISGDYVLLKRIAENIVMRCPNREFIHSWVDVPALMENVNSEFGKIMKSDLFKSKLIIRVSHLKEEIKNDSRRILSSLTIDNCIDVVFMSFLVQDLERISASLDFVFENLPRVVQKHSHLSNLAPEVIMLLLCNKRTIVKNNQGFFLPYLQCEKEVLKAVVKYVESLQKKTRGMSTTSVNRVKNLLSIVADPRVLVTNASVADKRLLKESQLSDAGSSCSQSQPENGNSHRQAISKKPPPPRKAHSMKFTISSSSHGSNKFQHYLFQPFISSSIQSLDEIGCSKGTFNEKASLISMDEITNEDYVLRKLYFSYRRCHTTNVPYVTKIGMQYSHKGNKKTLFITKSEPMNALPNDPVFENDLSKNDRQDLKLKPHISPIMDMGADTRNTSGDWADAGLIRHSMKDVSIEETVVKKAAVILKTGEHITSLSVLGQRALHNVEIVTNTGRCIRAHGIQDAPSDAKWVAIATPNGNSPFCLHAIYGDLYKSASGRSNIRDVGALWISARL